MRRIEFLVLVLILGVATCLVFAGVGKLLEVQARTACANNLKQIGLALHNYHDAHLCFPQAAMPNKALSRAQRLSWLLGIIPYMEASNFYSKVNLDKPWDADENRFAALTSIRPYQCPNYSQDPPRSTVVPTEYVGISGISHDAAERPINDPRAGFFGYDRRLSLNKIAGRTHTLLVCLETTRAEGAWSAAGRPTLRALEPSEPPYLGTTGQFGGLHRGGANAVWADAAVRFVPNDTSPAILEALASVQAGQELAPVGSP